MTQEELLNKYFKVLEQLNAELDGLIESSRRKRLVIVSNNTAELNRINQQDEQRLNALHKLENSRMKALDAIAEAWGISAGELTAQAMITLIDQSNQSALSFYQPMIELLKDNMTRLQDLNRENQELTLLALDYIDEVQHLILSVENPGVYSDEADGALDEHVRKSIKLIDKKV